MRLSVSEKAALDTALDGITGEVYLYGSRTDNSARGGDIDILIFTDAPAYRTAQIVERRFTMALEQKLDITVLNPASMSDDERAFVSAISKERLR